VTIGLVICIIFGAISLGACRKPKEVAQDAKLGFHTTEAVGEKEFVVILADFPDVERMHPESLIEDRVVGFLADYYRQASYNQLTLEGEMTKRYTLPNPVSHYRISPINMEVDRTRVLSLVNDVVNAADSDVKFSEDLYVMIVLGAPPLEYGMVGYCAVPGMLGFRSESPVTTKSGEIISNAAVFCETAHLGTHIHDSLHMLGGVISGQRVTPCLYDHDLQAKYIGGEDMGKILINMGYWDPLSSHWPYKKELPPAGLSSWTKLRLGWIQPSKIALVEPGRSTTVRLDPLADANSSTLVIKIPLTADNYYLIENRQEISSDVNLPSSGVLVLYCDDTIAECRHGEAPVRIMDANPSVPYFNDAAFDIGKNRIFIVLLSKEGQSYEILITTPSKAKAALRK
ncbi:hypothetical protein ACFLXT_05250, partial [Chloroflexota bacterium]